MDKLNLKMNNIGDWTGLYNNKSEKLLIVSYEELQKIFKKYQKIQTIYWLCMDCKNEWHQENFYHELPCDECHSKNIFSGKNRFKKLYNLKEILSHDYKNCTNQELKEAHFAALTNFWNLSAQRATALYTYKDITSEISDRISQ